MVNTNSQTKSDLIRLLDVDENGKPVLKLSPMPYFSIRVPTKEAYTELMRVYECGGWRWPTGELPTQGHSWERCCGDTTCVTAGTTNFLGGEVEKSNHGIFAYDTVEFMRAMFETVISLEGFYKNQNPKINRAMIDKINMWFDENSERSS
jgi:hypothetical protein